MEEVEEEGRRTILAKDRQYSNAIVVAAAALPARRNIFADYHGCRTTSFFSTFVGAREFHVPFCIRSPLSCTAAAVAFCVLVSLLPPPPPPTS